MARFNHYFRNRLWICTLGAR